MLSSDSNHDSAVAHIIDVKIFAAPAHLVALNDDDIDALEVAVNNFIARVTDELAGKVDLTVSFERRTVSTLTPRGNF